MNVPSGAFCAVIALVSSDRGRKNPAADVGTPERTNICSASFDINRVLGSLNPSQRVRSARIAQKLCGVYLKLDLFEGSFRSFLSSFCSILFIKSCSNDRFSSSKSRLPDSDRIMISFISLFGSFHFSIFPILNAFLYVLIMIH